MTEDSKDWVMAGRVEGGSFAGGGAGKQPFLEFRLVAEIAAGDHTRRYSHKVMVWDEEVIGRVRPLVADGAWLTVSGRGRLDKTGSVRLNVNAQHGSVVAGEEGGVCNRETVVGTVMEDRLFFASPGKVPMLKFTVESRLSEGTRDITISSPVVVFGPPAVDLEGALGKGARVRVEGPWSNRAAEKDSAGHATRFVSELVIDAATGVVEILEASKPKPRASGGGLRHDAGSRRPSTESGWARETAER